MRIAATFVIASLCSLAFGELTQPTIQLVSEETRPPDQLEALAAVAKEVAGFGFDPDEFRARILCDVETCTVDVFPEELETEEYRGFRGCPLKLCATLRYSKRMQAIVETIYWR